jgi:phosphatidate cytidylyltransferase
MLKNRIITASLLAPLIIAAILFLPPDGFAALWGVIILLAAWEWSGLAGLAQGGRIGFTLAILAVLVAARVFAMYWAPGELPIWFYAPVVAWWLAWGVAFRKMPEKLAKMRYPLAAKVLSGAFVLISAWVLMVWLRLNFSEYQVLYLVLLIWLADIAAYFFGKRWGFAKLVEAVSPGKTIEGVYGALLAAVLLAISVGLLVGLETMTLIDFVFLSLLTVAFSVCGDLFESLAKRVRGVKDSSGLLPGHGGVLDRIDSLLAAVAVFYAGSLLIPIFLALGSSLEPEIILQGDETSVMEAPQGEADYSGPMEVPPEMEDPAVHEHEGHEGDKP